MEEAATAGDPEVKWAKVKIWRQEFPDSACWESGLRSLPSTAFGSGRTGGHAYVYVSYSQED